MMSFMTRTLLRPILRLSASVLSAASLQGQDTKSPEPPVPDSQRPAAAGRHRGDEHVGVLQRLGLAAEQIEQIRQINADRRPLMQEAQKRFREASRALDAAIYADQVNEADIDTRLKDVQTAQAEVARIRSMNELSIRRVLTPEQLARFREMRQRFDERRDLRDQRPFGGGRPMRRKPPAVDHTDPASPAATLPDAVRPDM